MSGEQNCSVWLRYSSLPQAIAYRVFKVVEDCLRATNNFTQRRCILKVVSFNTLSSWLDGNGVLLN